MKAYQTSELSSIEWESLAILYTVEEPIPMDLFSRLTPLPAEAFLEMVKKAEAWGWIRRISPDRIALAADLSPGIQDGIRDIFTPQKRSMFIKRIEQNGLKDAIGPALMARLFSVSGRLEEAVELWVGLFEDAIREKDEKRAALYLKEAVDGLFALGDSGKKDRKRQFVQSVLNLQESAQYFSPDYFVGQTWRRLAKKAMHVADELGDKRSHALFTLAYGMFLSIRQPAQAIPVLAQGKKTAEDLDDPDIMAAAAGPIGIYYTIQGRHIDAIRYVERFQSDLTFSKNRNRDYNVSIVLGISAFFVGRFHTAVGILLSHWRTAKIKGWLSEAAMLRALLGNCLTVLGHTAAGGLHCSEALGESRALNYEFAMMMSQVGLALNDIREGRTEDAYQHFEAAYAHTKMGTTIRRFIFPWSLEIMHAFHREGFAPIPGWNFPEQFDRCMIGPNLHLRGVALRIGAEEKIRQGESGNHILLDLQASEEYLNQSGDPIELIKTQIAQVRLKLRGKDTTGAARLIRSIWNKGSDLRNTLPRETLRFLSEQAELSSEKHPAGKDVLGRLFQLLDVLYLPWEPDEGFDIMVRLSSQVLAAERGALFVFGKGRRTAAPELKGACNLTAIEVADPDFNIIMEQITRTFRENRPLVIRSEKMPTRLLDANVRSLLCLPLNINDDTKGVLFHSNTYLDNHFTDLDDRVLKTYSRYLIDFLKFIIKRSEKPSFSPQTHLPPRHNGEGEILTRNATMREIMDQTETAARSDSTVMILGETGTGKELFAQKIHTASLRSTGPLVIVDATAIPENLVESELFGHEKGAFTGADRMKKGQIEMAHTGTLFVDEVGELPLPTQVKLLRAFDKHAFYRIGGTRKRHSDFRLVVATNRDLSEEVAAGRFRQDLFYRLNVISIRLPPLRKRGKDIVLLAHHFFRKYTTRYRKENLQISPKDEARLMAYPWPGNIRELKNVMERAAILSSGNRLDLNLSTCRELDGELTPDSVLPMDDMQRQYIQKVLEITGGRIGGPKGAATLLGMKKTTLFSRMQKLGLR
ncbi:MAG: sigma-54-dependent Fis family transcriptional regulator [Deltaproteobacteria bacterium]|nr:sigma-54-dependent Fis family transcriptional regulator [Deltaproteobacteria bacterium]